MLIEDLNQKQKRILLLDDNPQVLQIVDLTLKREGFSTVKAHSGEEGLQAIKRHGLPHLALVDLSMPGMNGFEFCKKLHRFSDVPVIILTAHNEEDMVVKGINLYAEDYIVKPFRPRVLVARINRVLRRFNSFEYILDPITQIDDRLSVDFYNRTAFVAEEEVSLTPIETKLLHLLVVNSGRVVTTEHLLRRIWPLQDPTEDRLHVHVHRLRSKVEATPDEPMYIISRRGTGYTLPKRNGTVGSL